MKFSYLVLFLMVSSAVYSETTTYNIKYDFPGHGDDWYGHTGAIDIQQNFAPLTNITTQQGDDFCYGYESSIVGYNQAPELSRTQDMHTSYDFKYSGGTLCLSYVPPVIPPKPDFMFSNGFE